MRTWRAALLLAASALSACASTVGTGPAATANSGVRTSDRSEDRAAIHALLMAYGETLDARDFYGFARLFARDGTYGGGAGGKGQRAAEAAETLRRIFAENPSGAGEPNFHLFFNEVVRFTGPDSAAATSKSLWMVPGDNGAPAPALMAEYDDIIVREDGEWKFARRQVRGLLPAAPTAPPSRD